jgi:hypothetical protein
MNDIVADRCRDLGLQKKLPEIAHRQSRTAARGERTFVETTVAMEFAAS